MNLLAVFVENKPGQTARITKILADNAIDIRWVTIANNGGFGVMKFLVDKPDAAIAALKAQGILVAPLTALAVEVENRPGSLQTVAEHLAQAGLNLANCSGFVANERAVLVLELSELALARKAMEKAGIRVLEHPELVGL